MYVHEGGDNCTLDFQEPLPVPPASILDSQGFGILESHGNTLPPPRSRWQLWETFMLQIGQCLREPHQDCRQGNGDQGRLEGSEKGQKQSRGSLHGSLPPYLWATLGTDRRMKQFAETPL